MLLRPQSVSPGWQNFPSIRPYCGSERDVKLMVVILMFCWTNKYLTTIVRCMRITEKKNKLSKRNTCRGR